MTNQALLDGQLATVQARFAPGTIPAGGPPVYGTLATGATQDFNFTLAATCYKIIGVGGAGVQDLDLVIYDQAGTRLAADVATDNTPVVGLEQPFCPATGGTFRVEVRMYAGAGEFAVQMYRNP